MKKIILMSMLSLATVANAQKGSFYVGGHLGLNSSKSTYLDASSSTTSERSKTFSWEFSPEFGTFLSDNIQVGLGLMINSSKTTNPLGGNDKQTFTQTNFGGTIYGRYFFGEKTFKPFVGLNVLYLPGTNKSETTIGKNTSSTSTYTDLFGTNLNAGFAFAIAEKFTLVGSVGVLGFNSIKTKNTSGDIIKSNSFGLDVNSLGNRFTIGLYYTL